MTVSVRQIERGSLVVSCQARADNPLHGAAFMAAMALAAVQGGAKAIRANGMADIAAIRRAVDVPIIAINKRFNERFPVTITPDLGDAVAVAEAGGDIIAIDATARPRDGLPLRELMPAIRAACPGIALMADIATLAEAEAAQALGFDIIATTLSGYTDETAARLLHGPDLDLISALVARHSVPIVAEGRFETPAQVREAFARGSHAVVVGTAITNPREITRRFVAGAPR
jgi:putative N-acetylmannosamine-6-phosphate epimerase